MARVSANRMSVYPYGSADFQSDPNFTSNRIYAGEILRINGGTVPDGVTFTIPYIAPIPSAPTYTITVNVKRIPSVVSLNSLDANPTGALYVHWQAVFDRPVANVTAANFSLNNSGNISPTPTITNVAPTTAGNNMAWTVTVYSTGSNSGILGLSYQGTTSEVPAVTPQFVGGSYQYDSSLSVQPYFSQLPPATLTVNVKTTPPAR